MVGREVSEKLNTGRFLDLHYSLISGRSAGRLAQGLHEMTICKKKEAKSRKKAEGGREKRWRGLFVVLKKKTRMEPSLPPPSSANSFYAVQKRRLQYFEDLKLRFCQSGHHLEKMGPYAVTI